MSEPDLHLDVSSGKVTAVLVAVVVLVLGSLVALRPDGGPPDGAAPAAPAATSPGSAAPGTVGPDGVESGTPTSGRTAGSGGPGATGVPGAPGGPGGPGDPGGSEVCIDERNDVRLRVVVFNIRSGRVRGLEAVAQALEAVRPDVVLLQEVDQLTSRTGRVDQPAALGNRLGMVWAYGPNLRFGGGSYGTVILSRYPLAGLRNTALPNQRGEEQRGLLHATTTVDGVEISLYNTHLEAGRVSALRQRQMRRVAEVLRADDNPVIFGGDLNAGPGSTEVGIARGLLADTWATVGTGKGATVPAVSPRGRIDYVFHSPGTVRPVRSLVLPAVVSDHRGLLADYVVPGAGTRTCVDLPSPDLQP